MGINRFWSLAFKLSDKRRVTITDFKGKTLVSMREYYRRDGKELSTAKTPLLQYEALWPPAKKDPELLSPSLLKVEPTKESQHLELYLQVKLRQTALRMLHRALQQLRNIQTRKMIIYRHQIRYHLLQQKCKRICHGRTSFLGNMDWPQSMDESTRGGVREPDHRRHQKSMKKVKPSKMKRFETSEEDEESESSVDDSGYDSDAWFRIFGDESYQF